MNASNDPAHLRAVIRVLRWWLWVVIAQSAMYAALDYRTYHHAQVFIGPAAVVLGACAALWATRAGAFEGSDA